MRRMKVMSVMFLLLTLVIVSACSQTTYQHVPQQPAQQQVIAQQSPAINRILDRGELIVGMSGNQPPLNMTTREGKIIGIDADLALLISKAMNVGLRIDDMPFPDLLPALESGKVDMVISGLTITPQRNLKVAFVGPYFISGKSFVTKAETIASAKDPSEINKKDVKLAVLENSTSQSFVESFIPDAAAVKTKDYDEAMNLVFDDKVDALIADYPFCLTTVLRYPEQELVSLITPITYEPLGIAVPGNDPLLVNWLENYLGAIDGSGLLDKLEDRWFDNSSWIGKLQ